MAEFERAKHLLPRLALALVKLKISCAEARIRAGQAPVVEFAEPHNELPLWLSPERFASGERLAEVMQSTMADIEVAGTSLGSSDGAGPFGMYFGPRPDFPRVVGKAIPLAEASIEGYMAACADPASLDEQAIDFIRFGSDSFEAISKTADRELNNLLVAALSVGRAVAVIEQYEAAGKKPPPYTTSIETAAGVEMAPDSEPVLIAGICQIGLDQLAEAIQKEELRWPDPRVMHVLTSELADARFEAQITRGDGHWTLLDQHALHQSIQMPEISGHSGPEL